MIKQKFNIEIEVQNPYIARAKILLSALKTFKQAFLSIEDKLNSKYNKKVGSQLRVIAKSAVDKFYESYEPHIYKRGEGLYTAFKVIANDEEWTLKTGPEFMKRDYKAGKEYVYINSFEQGFHGGAIDGPKHPDPGTPYWRKPPPDYTFWGKPATQGPAPQDLIDAENPGGYIEQQEDEYFSDFKILIQPYLNNLLAALNDFLS